MAPVRIRRMVSGFQQDKRRECAAVLFVCRTKLRNGLGTAFKIKFDARFIELSFRIVICLVPLLLHRNEQGGKVLDIRRELPQP